MHFAKESIKKVNAGQAKLVFWDDINENPLPQLKILPIAAIPHKSKAFQSILDLSFRLWLKNSGFIESVNNTTIKMVPQEALDQLGHALSRIIHAFAKAEEDAKIFMAKWDIKDGFWQMDCKAREEYNFAYFLPKAAHKSSVLVIPTLLQMGWVESPSYFCAATETARDIATDNSDTPIGSLTLHKFVTHVMGDKDCDVLLATLEDNNHC